MSVGDFLKKLLGFPTEPDIKPMQPQQEKSFGDLEYELAKRKAREERENPSVIIPKDPQNQF